MSIIGQNLQTCTAYGNVSIWKKNSSVGQKKNKQTNRLTVLSFDRMQSQNLQQPGVCGPACPVCESRVRVCLPADQNVHHSYEFCQGLGSRVQVRQPPSPSPTLITQTPQKMTPLSNSCNLKEYCYIRSWKYVFWHNMCCLGFFPLHFQTFPDQNFSIFFCLFCFLGDRQWPVHPAGLRSTWTVPSSGWTGY